MNTERDNFHDWAREKPDSTSFSGLHRSELHDRNSHPRVRRGRLVFLIVLAVAVGVGVKYVVAAL